ncbi:MAG: tyrosine-type recombinase/integrase [Flavobacteriales bacterium]|nr:tyrosine-type recombinase/integrase [Flavobacteriales bacterium]
MTLLTKVIDNFLLHCQFEKHLNGKTLKAYSTDLVQFRKFIDSGSLCIEDITKEQLIAFHRNLHKSYRIKSIKRKLACIKAMFNFYEFEHDDFINPFRKIRLKLKEPFKVPVVMNFTEVRKVFEKVYSEKERAEDKAAYSYKELVRDLAFLELLFATGLRVSEITHLKTHNINLSEGLLKVHGKGGRDRVIQICNSSVTDALFEYRVLFNEQIETTGFFFINRLGSRLSEQSARAIVKKHAKQLGNKKPITPHTYRHTFATLLLEEGVDIKYIQRLLGHSSILTTQIYTHVSSAKQREILTTKHPRNRMAISV